MNYYDWLASQYAYRYPDLYDRMIPLIDDEIEGYGRTELNPNEMNQLVDNIMERFNNLYPQSMQFGFGGGDAFRDIIYIFLISRLLRRRRYPRYPGYPGYSY